MKVASRILFLIGGILAILMAVLMLVLSIVFFVDGGIAAAVASDPSTLANLPQDVVKALNDLAKSAGVNTWQALAQYCIGIAVMFLFVAIFAIPGAILSFIARKEKASMGLIITATVFNILCWNPVSVVGGVLGIVDCAVNKK